MKKIGFCVLCLLFTACGKEDGVPQYNYKTIKVTSIYTNWKKDQQSAEKKAEAELDHFAKSACRETIAKGWSLVAIKNKGQMNCEQTAEGYHCRKKDIELKCQQVIEVFP